MRLLVYAEAILKTLSFMFPITSGIMGGVQALIINLIQHYSSNGSRKVRLYDYSYGLIKKELDLRGVNNFEFVCLDISDRKIFNKGNEVFILTDTLALKYPQYFINKDVTILIWDVYTPSWYYVDKIAGKFKIPTLKDKLIRSLYENDAVIFMEQSGIKYFNQTLDMFTINDIIPVPVSPPSCKFKYLDSDRHEQKVINLGYIGRSVDWKVKPLNKILKDFNTLNVCVELHVFTNDLVEFQEYLKLADDISVTYYEGISGKELEEILIKNVELGFSMGLSALEIAKLGIPTILADFSMTEFPQSYKYQWLHETSQGCLGQDVSLIENWKGRKSLKEILYEYNDDIESISCISLEFVNNVHNINNVAEKLFNKAQESRLTCNNLKNLPYKIYHLFYRINRIRKKNDQFWGWGIK
jgi:hypothetical protein